MPTVTLARSDLFPVGTTVGIYPAVSQKPIVGPPTSPAIASAAVDAAGLLTVTNAGILQGVRYVAYAQVGGVDTFCACRSTLDVSDTGRATGTGTLTSGSAAVTGLSATTGAFAVGQRIRAASGGALPPGTYIETLSGGNATLSDKATASGATNLEADGGSPAVVPPDKGVGALAVPLPITTWRGKVKQRRQIIGTS